jgi:hypothetical protein
LKSRYLKKEIIYNSLDLIQPDKYNELIDDLKAHLGIEIHRAKNGRVDPVKNQVRLVIYFPASERTHESEED